jgi:hypothetical protein
VTATAPVRGLRIPAVPRDQRMLKIRPFWAIATSSATDRPEPKPVATTPRTSTLRRHRVRVKKCEHRTDFRLEFFVQPCYKYYANRGAKKMRTILMLSTATFFLLLAFAINTAALAGASGYGQ